tara:strand:- start:1669 stop:3474 length:1806 start_codon:yes stop_codon:yes gene_type:complete
MPTQGASITVQGGLDLVSSSHALFRTPGAATVLQNFESSTTGGYRRISGYTKWGGNSGVIPSGTSTDTIHGITNYADGVLVAQSDDLYFSTTGTSYVQINKDTFTSGPGTVSISAGSPTVTGTNTTFTTSFIVNDDIKIDNNFYKVLSITSDTVLTLDINANTGNTQNGLSYFVGGIASNNLAAATTIVRTNQSNVKFINFESTGGQNGTIYGVDGQNKIFEFFIDDNNKYHFEEIERSSPVGCSLIERYSERIIVSGQTSNPSTVYFSTRLKPYDFEGASAGSIDVGDVVIGIKVFRNSLIIFCKNSIYELTNLDSTPIIKSVTKNIGCVSGNSIQEIGGDLIFLAPDGLRTVAGTARIDDVELGSISRKILPLINNILNNFGNFTVSSMVIRERSQYRLFYYQSGQADSGQKGIIGTFKYSAEGVPAFEWSETKGLPVTVCTSNLNSSGTEVIFHADESGFIFQHDTGDSFNGSNVVAEFQTPDMDYGDNGLRKSLYKIKANIEPEGLQNSLNLRIRYDFESSEVPQPGNFAVGNLSSAALFGTAKFSQAVFGATTLPSKSILVTGSGFSNNFKFFSDDTNAPYSVNGMFVSFIAGGRR